MNLVTCASYEILKFCNCRKLLSQYLKTVGFLLKNQGSWSTPEI
jgi:hypothetical protein